MSLNICSIGQAARGSAKNIQQQKGSAAQKVWELLPYTMDKQQKVYSHQL